MRIQSHFAVSARARLQVDIGIKPYRACGRQLGKRYRGDPFLTPVDAIPSAFAPMIRHGRPREREMKHD
ncbi:hypothetical protein [Burkholderia diffusa]|uniref:hypothetical protein n=1 Tax=Burkholderia diffusa TaxID=488732 RepID=UPI002ABE73B2|nr:hypothetical protein [Burkholderia diffusa]